MVNDVAVVGGGPAGAAVAIALGTRGVRVALYEQSSLPRLKPCGEGLLPHGVEALIDLIGTVPDAPRMCGLRFVVHGTSIDADFPSGTGLVVRRDRFDRWLLDHAAATPNVDLRLGARYVPSGEPMVVGADGKRSMFHRRLPAHPGPRRRVGLSTHMGGIEGLGNRVEVFFHSDGELYVAPSGGGEALVAALFPRTSFRRDGIDYLLQAIPEMRARTCHAERTAPQFACAPLSLYVPQVVAPGLLLIGDAAGAPDPITGEGIALALTSATPAANAIVSGDFATYAVERLRRGRTAERLARLLLRLARVDRRTASLLLRRRALAPTLMEVAVGERPLNAATMLRAVL